MFIQIKNNNIKETTMKDNSNDALKSFLLFFSFLTDEAMLLILIVELL